MKKIFLLTALAGMFAWSTASAQVRDPAMSGAKLSIGADFALPTGNTSNAYKLGFGGSLQYQQPIADQLNFTASAGYLNFTGKDAAGGLLKFRDYAAIPVKVGLRYFLAENFYAGGELGAAFGTSDGARTSFVYTPGIGVEFPVSDKGSIDLGARYEGWSSGDYKIGDQVHVKNFVGIRLAYNFGL
ncbi:outer membrane beta-barrel protein [Pedobacter antarcticus]|uniref:outer membrane beta-barrel protein n=1 Tax=Pedobacter antarcticus TaxID=34086 RepID=UPI002930F661|nr:outer membrane beta-barrel protein [Pedobacter antarcticus]